MPPDVSSRSKATGKAKRLYRGIFVLGNQTLIRRTKAYSKEQAKTFMIQQIAKKMKVSNVACLMKVFDGHLDNFTIEEV